MKLKILIRGIRANSHSSGVVNQFQLLEFARFRETHAIYHEDVPNPWGGQGLGFSEEDARLIASYSPPPPGERVDVVYALGGPNPLGYAARGGERSFLYVVTEFGNFGAEVEGIIRNHLAGGGYLIAPSAWSRQRTAERLGVAAERIFLVPHGVSAKYFFPLTPAANASNRTALGLAPDDFLFFNSGAMTWNKGVDLLLAAFELVLGRYPQARLLLKDSSHLYNLRADSLIQGMVAEGCLRVETLARIQVYAGHLDLQKMLCLYNAADCYLSPYRAEGFNLPVLEAVACGTPVVVTAGGPTSDFAGEEVAALVASRPVSNEVGHYLEPEFESLVAAMSREIEAPRKGRDSFRQAAVGIAGAYGWETAVDRLMDLFLAQA